MTPDERDILHDIQNKLDRVIDDMQIKVDRHDVLLCDPGGIVDTVHKNTITLYGDAEKEGLVSRSKTNRALSLGALLGVAIYAITHAADFAKSIGKLLGLT
jgi:hypothetical protein